jgi:hypothetical protein
MRWGDGEVAVIEESDLCFLFKGSGVAARFFLKKKDERVATASLLERIGLGVFLCFPSIFLISLPPLFAYG